MPYLQNLYNYVNSHTTDVRAAQTLGFASDKPLSFFEVILRPSARPNNFLLNDFCIIG